MSEFYFCTNNKNYTLNPIHHSCKTLNEVEQNFLIETILNPESKNYCIKGDMYIDNIKQPNNLVLVYYIENFQNTKEKENITFKHYFPMNTYYKKFYGPMCILLLNTKYYVQKLDLNNLKVLLNTIDKYDYLTVKNNIKIS